jgi:hypothetical protein
MASNKYDASTTNTCHRFCRTEMKNLQVPIPSMVQKYNADHAAADQRHSMQSLLLPISPLKWRMTVRKVSANLLRPMTF